LDAAVKHDSDMIGLSGLITPSLDEMVHVASEMQRAGMTMPLLIGGATTSRVHTALRIAPAYEGPVVHVLDASRAVGVAGTLVSDTLKEALVAETAAEYEKIRIQRAGGGQSALVPLEQARANGFPTDFVAHPPGKPNFTGTMTIDDVRVETLIPYIDWTPFFRAWELHGNYPAILTDAVVGESATSLFADAQAMLKRIVAEEWLHPKGVISIWPVRREGDDVVLFGDESRAAPIARLPFLRQQIAKRDGRANMCLADFINPEADWLGCFAVQAGEGIDTQLARFKAAHDDYNDILLKALADRLAEAFAEYLHERVRREIWGHEQGNKMSCDDLIRERYTGIRPAPGYPACPEHSLKTHIFDLMSVEERAGITLTDSFAMWPTAAVSGFYFAHPQSAYFGVARIGEDQLLDYASRLGVSRERATQLLRPNLD
jgi:5-methyltetrahydrofolate--homocysteine methyltransferase